MPPHNYITRRLIPLLLIITGFLLFAKLGLIFYLPVKYNLDKLPILAKPLTKQDGKINVPVLVYHHVRQSKSTDHNAVSPEIFNEQMKWLKDNGYKVISYSDFYKFLTSGADAPPKSVVLTFDDNYKDQYTTAWPILKQYNYPAAFFINYNTVNWWGYLSWPMLKDLLAQNMEIGSHSLKHQNLTNLNTEAIIYQIRQGKLKLEYRLGRPIEHFSYPYGQFDNQIIQQVANAGFSSALTNCGSAVHDRANSPYEISRITIGNNLEEFKNIFK